MTEQARYLSIARHYERRLAEYGDSHLGVDWPNAADADLRYRVMFDLIRPDVSGPSRLLDIGCGASHMLEFLRREHLDTAVAYSGLDISADFIDLSREKFPNITFWCGDLLVDDLDIGDVDYAVMNGVLTEKLDLSFDEMFAFATAMIERAFSIARIGIAFNVMSAHVDWERSDLFHLPFDRLAAWLTENLSRRFVFRSDYGLYEYTTYLYH